MLAMAGFLSGCGEPDPGPGTIRHGSESQEIDKDRSHRTGDFPAKVFHYSYSFDLRPTQDSSRQAHSGLLMSVPSPGGDCTVLKGPPGLTRVLWNGAPASRVEPLADGALRICGLPVSEGHLLFIEADVTVPEMTYDYTQVGFSRRQDRKGNTFSYLMSWVEQCDRLGLCDDAPGRLATFSFEVQHAENDVVLCPGQLFRDSPTETFCLIGPGRQAPTYSAFAIASNPAWVKTLFAQAGATRLEFYEVPGGLLAPALNPADFTDYLGWLKSLLGPLPYGDTLRVVGGPTEFLGMEHPANIVLREDLPLLRSEYANGPRHTLMHEIAHQWSGNRTTMAEAYDFAWKEAIAEYLSYVYEAQKWPSDAARTRVYWDRMARSAMFYPKPADHPEPFLTFAADVYGTGPMIFFLQLETLLPGGQADVVEGIQHFLSVPGVRDTEQLRSSLEQAAGLPEGSLWGYFDAWVYGSGEPDWPYFDVTTEQVDGQLTLTATQQSYEGGIYPVAVTVRVRGETQTKDVVLNYGLAPTSGTLSVTVPFPEPVLQVSVDPDSRVVNRRFFGALEEAAPPRWHF
ncbi:M1 family aminopeptidase [Vitiosangium sp. GDMCC 1.1324]|uniref:M1 family aminopeptidase n=1 Tax=Vitiosangium sp. (strain GDMCC 1.1324) TaxID=2138576 RepID=UPI00130EF207|nr:M1 family aminopeptidase [Vitiosangium sp. GDMCC 1.1324]